MSELEARGRGYAYTHFPPEIWHLIVKKLSKADQRSYLSLSRLFRDLARPLLSVHITLHLGIWNASSQLEYDRPSEFQAKEQQKAAANTEKLQYIMRDAQFARSVKVLTVKAFTRSQHAYFSTEPVVDALKMLTRLQSFRWYGTEPSLSASVLDALASACGSTLSELRVFAGQAGEDAASFLPQFTNLHTLSLAGKSPQRLAYPSTSGPAPNNSLFAQRAPSALRSLSIWGDAVWDTPLHVLSGLRELSLKDPQSLEKLDTVFTNCPQLRSLEILTSSTSAEPEILAALSAAPDALPHLTSFKLIFAFNSFLVHADPLAAFLQPKQHLRRLDLQFNDPFDSEVDYAQYLDLFAGHPQLEVAGLMLAGGYFMPEDLQMLDARLPLGLSALLVSFSFRAVDDAAQGHFWIPVLERRASLGYLHVVDYNTNILGGIRPALLTGRMPSLELFGHNKHISRIECDAATGQSAYGPAWEDEKISFRTAEDFECEDWEWLLRSHDWDGLYPLTAAAC